MSDWVRFHRELCRGTKRALPRSVRFIYLEISLEARLRRGFIVLPGSMSSVDAVHDLIGGNRKEIVEALKVLSDESEPMIAFETHGSERHLVVTSWKKWNPGDQTAAERQQRKRDKDRDVTREDRDGTRDVTRDSHGLDRDSDRDVTEPRARALLSSPLLSSESSEGDSEREPPTELVETPCPDALPPEVMADLDGEAAMAGWPNPKAEWPHFQADRRGKGIVRADWREAFRSWLMQGRKFAERDRFRGSRAPEPANNSPSRKKLDFTRPPTEPSNV